jgi:hypothetical protein
MAVTRFLKRFLFPAILVILAVYAADSVRLHFLQDQFGSVQVKRMYEVRLKNRKTEYLQEDPQAVPCVNSAFPQMGYAPCWYLTRHRVQIVEVDAGRTRPTIDTP